MGTESAATRIRGIRRLSALVLVLCGLQVMPAGAQEPPLQHPPFDDPETMRIVERQRKDAEKRMADRQLPEAVEERKRARGSFRGRGRAKAVGLARKAFPRLFGTAKHGVLDLSIGQQVKAYGGRNSAVIDLGPGRGAAVVDSTLPLRVPDESGALAPVDLTLTAAGGGWEPENAAVPLRIEPDAASAAATVDGVEIALPGAATAGERVGDDVFYPDVAEDADAWFTPDAAGLRFAFQLRSSAAPEQLRLQLRLPAGVALRAGPDGRSVELVRGIERVALVSAPAAFDAEGMKIESTLTIDGDALVVGIAHRDADPMYPIAVDPVYENQDSWKYGTAGNGGWVYYEERAYFPRAFSTDKYGTGFYVFRQQHQWYPNNSFGEWQYRAPNWESFVWRADFIHVRHEFGDTNSTQGIWAPRVANFQHRFTTSYNFDYTNNYFSMCASGNVSACGEANADPYWSGGNYAQSSLSPNRDGTIFTHWPTMYLGGARVWMGDKANPYPPERPAPPAGWVKNVPAGAGYGVDQVPVTIRDAGLGMWQMWLDVPGKARQYSTGGGCAGTNSSPCPNARSYTFSYAGMSEGIQTITAQGNDVVGNVATGTWPLKIDRGAPVVTLSGDLSTRRNQSLTGTSYPLTISATDGSTTSNAAKRSGVASIKVLVDGVQRGLLNNPSSADSAPLTYNWTLDNAGDLYREGKHTISFEVRDRVGNVSTSTPINFIRDREAPQLDDVRHEDDITRWYGDEVLTVSADASDHGAGVKALKVETPLAAGGIKTWTASNACAGTYTDRCPTGPNLLGGVNWSFERGTSDWTYAVSTSSLAAGSTTTAVHGGRQLRILREGGTTPAVTTTERTAVAVAQPTGTPSASGTMGADSVRVPATAGRTYRGGVSARPESGVTASSFRAEIAFYTATGSQLSRTVGATTAEQASPTWTPSAPVQAVAPAGTATAALRVWWPSVTNNRWHDVDAASLVDVAAAKATLSVEYDTGAMPEGVLSATQGPKLYVEDAGSPAKRSEELRWGLKVDTSAPELTLSGPLKAMEGQQLPAGEHHLVVDAADGSTSTAAAQRSGIESVEVWVDDALVDEASQACAAGSCPMHREAIVKTSELTGGEHEVRVTAIDQVDNETTQTFKVRTPCCASAAATWGTLDPLQQMMVGDVDGDGRGDLVGRVKATGALNVALSNGAAFGTPVAWGQLDPAYDAYVADVDGDADSDVVGRHKTSGALLVLLSTGLRFQAGMAGGTWPTAFDVHFADVDQVEGDDLVGRRSDTGEIRVGYADGTLFAPGAVEGTLDPAFEMRVGDVDDDGMADVIGRRRDTGAVVVGLAGANGFGTPAPWGTFDAPGALAAFDFHSDMKVDLVTTDPATGSLAVSPSTGTAFSARQAWGTVRVPASDIAYADVDGDSAGDVVLRDAAGMVRVQRTSSEPPSAPAAEPYDAEPGDVYDTDPEFTAPAAGAAQALAAGPCTVLTAKEGGARLRMAAQDDAVMLNPNTTAEARWAVLQRLRDAGVTVLRLNAHWGRIQANQPGMSGEIRYHWTTLENAVADARCAGMDVMITITGAATNGLDCSRDYWPVTDPALGCRNDDPNNPDDAARAGVTGVFDKEPTNDVNAFAAFTRDVVRHFSGAGVPTERRVQVYSLWNEPNGRSWLVQDRNGNGSIGNGDKSKDGDEIAPLYRQIYGAARDAGAAALVQDKVPPVRFLLGELSELPRSPLKTGEFLEAVATGPRLYVGGVSVHPYQHTVAPHKGSESGRMGIGRLGGLAFAIRTLHRQGRMSVPGNKIPRLYATEFGYWNRLWKRGARLNTVHTEFERAHWLPRALWRARKLSRTTSKRKTQLRWMLLYQAREAAPDDGNYPAGQARCPDNMAPGPIAPGVMADRYKWDMGFFGEGLDTAVTGQRCYGRRAKSDPSVPGRPDDYDYPQNRRAYCAVWRWAQRHGYTVRGSACP